MNVSSAEFEDEPLRIRRHDLVHGLPEGFRVRDVELAGERRSSDGRHASTDCSMASSVSLRLYLFHLTAKIAVSS